MYYDCNGDARYVLVWLHKSTGETFFEYRYSMDEIRIEKTRIEAQGHMIIRGDF